jgi:hypothetical protein
MKDITVYLNEYLVDLDESSSVQITINGFNIENPIRRFASFTSTLTLAKSNNNEQFIKMYSEKSSSTVPYETLKITVFETGKRIFKGTCFLKRVNNKFNIAGITEESDVFDRLKTFACSQIFETLGDGNGSGLHFKPLNHKLLTAATLYTQRNGLALAGTSPGSLYAPLVDYGKQDIIPNNLVENYSFTTVQFPWTVETLPDIASTIGWTFTAPDMTSAAMALNTVSLAIVNRTVRIYAGFRYVLTFVYGQTANVTTVAEVFAINDDDEVVSLGSNTSSTVGTKTATIEFTSNVNYKAIGIYFRRTAIVGNQVVVVGSANIADTSYVVIKDPFYLPMFPWVDAIKKAIAKVFTGTFTHNHNFTTAQNALVDSCLIQSIREGMQYPKWFLEDRNDIQQASGTQVIGLGDNVVAFPNKIKGNFGLWLSSGDWDGGYTLGNQYYSTPSMVDTDGNGGFYADIRCDMVVNVTAITGASPQAWFELEIASGIFFRSPVFSTTGRKQFTMSTRSKAVDSAGALVAPFSYPKGVRIGATDAIMDVHSRTGGTISSYSVTVEYARFTVTPVPYPQDEAVFMPGFVLPDFTAYDLLKDYLIRTCSLIKYSSIDDSLKIASVESIINNKKAAKNWTSKRNKLVDDIEFSLSEYAQLNKFTDKEGDDNEFANMSIIANNDNITPEKTFYESKFSSITDTPVKGAPAADIKAFEYDSELVYEQSVEATSTDVQTKRERTFEGINEKATLLKMRDSVVTDPVVHYDATTAATFKVAAYAKWSEFKALFYPGVESALDKVKVLRREYNLTPEDIGTLDIFTLIYDDNAYYLIVNLKYVPGEISEVVIFKVN